MFPLVEECKYSLLHRPIVLRFAALEVRPQHDEAGEGGQREERQPNDRRRRKRPAARPKRVREGDRRLGRPVDEGRARRSGGIRAREKARVLLPARDREVRAVGEREQAATVEPPRRRSQELARQSRRRDELDLWALAPPRAHG